MRSRAIGALGALVLGATGLVVTATASPAAATCSHAHSNRDSNNGYINASDAAVRPGPHISCGLNGRAYRNQGVDYHCYTTGGDYYNGWSTWTWGYVPSIGRSGWINDALLSGNGSYVRC
jgi:hypothetical protein